MELWGHVTSEAGTEWAERNPSARAVHPMTSTQNYLAQNFYSFNKQLLRTCYVLGLRLGTGAKKNKTSQGSRLLDTFSVPGTALDGTLELTRELLKSQGRSHTPDQLDPSLCRLVPDTVNF